MEPLVANAIHDIKNSLHALNSRLGEAERNCPSPALHEARALSHHINGQLVQLLTLYREGEGSLRLSIDDRELFYFIEELRLEPTGSRDGVVRVDFDVQGADEIGMWAFDAYQVKLVLTDALRNAVRHAREQVTFSLRRGAAAGIEFIVCDDGPGYPDHILHNDETVMGAHGSGLGLRFARLIAARHRTPDGRCGEILIDNDGISGGGRLRLRLP